MTVENSSSRKLIVAVLIGVILLSIGVGVYFYKKNDYSQELHWGVLQQAYWEVLAEKEKERGNVTFEEVLGRMPEKERSKWESKKSKIEIFNFEVDDALDGGKPFIILELKNGRKRMLDRNGVLSSYKE